MRPKKHETTGSGDLFRARLDQIINMRHELVQLAGNPPEQPGGDQPDARLCPFSRQRHSQAK
jgi:hypothetical protein